MCRSSFILVLLALLVGGALMQQRARGEGPAPSPYDVGYFQDAQDNRIQVVDGKVRDFSGNTVIVWINGDADRFRPAGDLGSDVVRLDTLDVAEIQKYSRMCRCNIVLFVDQRGSDEWFTHSEHFAAKYSVYSQGEQIQEISTVGTLGLPRGPYFRKRATDTYEIVGKFAEVNQADESFLVELLKSAEYLFPGTDYHLVYRGHSFALPKNLPGVPPFDYSHPESAYHISDFVNSIRKSGMHLSSVTFAACSMSYLSMALGLMPYVDYMVGTQINVHETGLTGFSFRYLSGVTDRTRPLAHVHGVLSTMLERFRTVEQKELFIRESPLALINLKALRPHRAELVRAKDEVVRELQSGPQKYKKALVSAKASQRYLELKKKEGSSPAVLAVIRKKMAFRGANSTSYDFLSVLRNMGQAEAADLFGASILLYDTSDFSGKTGLSVDVSFD